MQFASFREVMMQALVGDELRESPYLVLRVPPNGTAGWFVFRGSTEDVCSGVAGCTQALVL